MHLILCKQPVGSNPTLSANDIDTAPLSWRFVFACAISSLVGIAPLDLTGILSKLPEQKNCAATNARSTCLRHNMIDHQLRCLHAVVVVDRQPVGGAHGVAGCFAEVELDGV